MKGEVKMNSNEQLYWDYFNDWFELFRKAKIRPVTQRKYKEAQKEIKRLAPDLRLCDINRMKVQKLLVEYGKTHELETAKGFFHMVKGSLEDARYNGLIDKDPTYKLRPVSSKDHKVTRAMYLELDQAERLEKVMSQDHSVTGNMLSFDMRTGLRFAELLGITPKDVDLKNKMLTINKTWLYKQRAKSDFGETKNQSSKRTIILDDLAIKYISNYLPTCGENEPVFVKALSMEAGFKPTKQQKYASIYQASIGRRLTRYCKEADVPRIGIHGLRHTHVCLLYNAGVSLLSIAKRLGHANTTTTQKVYLNLIKAKEQKDNDVMLKALNSLNEQEKKDA